LNVRRIRAGLAEISQRPIRMQRTERLTPLAFPLWADRLHARVSSEAWVDRLRRMADRLAVVLAQTEASRLVILGDLIHGPEGWTPELRELLVEWKRRWSHTLGDPHVEAILIRGNHDRMAGDPPPSLGIQVQEEGWKLGPMALHHEPVSVSADPVLMGHLHPVVRLRGPGDRMQLPCFIVGSRRIVLPAFGTFTGGAPFDPEDGDRIFAIGEGQVLEVPVRP